MQEYSNIFIPWPCLSTFYSCQIYIRFFWALLFLLTQTFPLDQFLFPLPTRFSQENDEFHNPKALLTMCYWLRQSISCFEFVLLLFMMEGAACVVPSCWTSLQLNLCDDIFLSFHAMTFSSKFCFYIYFFESYALDSWCMSVNEVSWSRGRARVCLVVRPFTRPSIGRPVLPLSHLTATYTDLFKHSLLLWMLVVRNTQRDRGLL